jgi:hypothetical protein
MSLALDGKEMTLNRQGDDLIINTCECAARNKQSIQKERGMIAKCHEDLGGFHCFRFGMTIAGSASNACALKVYVSASKLCGYLGAANITI